MCRLSLYCCVCNTNIAILRSNIFTTKIQMKKLVNTHEKKLRKNPVKIALPKNCDNK